MKSRSTGITLSVAVAINLSMGVLYGWSIFLGALETELSVNRSTISAVPSLALAFFTIGALTHQWFLRRINARLFVLTTCSLAAAGNLLFSAMPSIESLLFGYGVLFGFGAGLSYGVALFLAASSTNDQRLRGTAIGITTASFAVSGLILSLLNQNILEGVTPHLTFVIIGVIQLLVGVASFLLVGDAEPEKPKSYISEQADQRSVDYTGSFFFGLGASFFFVCFVGLMTVSHSVGILSDRDLPIAFAAYAPFLVNAGYIVFGTLAGAMAARLPVRSALLIVSFCALVGVGVLIFFDNRYILSVGLAAIGASLGASASVYPVVIGRRYGVENIGAIYGRVLIAYGISGLIAPWLTGALFVWTGNYFAALWIALALSAFSIFVVVATTQTRPATGLCQP
jgi:MFS family permease